MRNSPDLFGFSETLVIKHFGGMQGILAAAALAPNIQPGKEVPCEQCGTVKFHYQTQLDRAAHLFCSPGCTSRFYSIEGNFKPRSKLEVWLEEKLPTEFPGLVIQFNDRKQVYYELDIFIPSFKLAFEINGPSHYWPIYGTDAFERVKKNDAIKKQRCEAQGIQLFILDVSTEQRASEKRKKQHLDYIKSVIQAAIERHSQ